MRRVRSNSLTVDDRGALRLRDEIYSGLAFRVATDGVVEGIDVVEAGRTIGRSDDWLALPEGGRRVDRSTLEMAGDYGPFLWCGAPITGVVYAFDTFGVCGVEQVHRDGMPCDEGRRAWYPSGTPRQLVSGDEGSSWFEDGRLQSKRTGGTTVFNLVVRDGRLAAIVLHDATLFDVTTVERLTFATEVLLVGPAIDATTLAALRDRTGLRDVTCLRLVETSVGPEVADLLAPLPALSTLWLTKNPALVAGDAERIRAALPRCVVHYVEGEPDDE